MSTSPPGTFTPLINRNRCEAKGPCVDVCPYDVLTIEPVPDRDKRDLTLTGRLKLWAHGGKQAYVTYPDRCQACGLCVKACPERAITLQRRS